MKRLANGDEQQPSFPDLDDCPELVVLVQKGFRHTGKIVSKDDELCRNVMLDLLAPMSRRRVALKYRISRNTVNSIADCMRERGELEPLKKELMRNIGKLLAVGVEEIVEAIEEGRVDVSKLPVGMGIFLDKYLDLTGEPSSRVETNHNVTITIEALQAQFKQLKAPGVIDLAPASLSDSASCSNVEKAQ